jgi:hypothetical protein
MQSRRTRITTLRRQLKEHHESVERVHRLEANGDISASIAAKLLGSLEDDRRKAVAELNALIASEQVGHK